MIIFTDDNNIFFTSHNVTLLKDTIYLELPKRVPGFPTIKASLDVNKTNIFLPTLKVVLITCVLYFNESNAFFKSLSSYVFRRHH